MSLEDPLLSVSLFCHLASIILCALILSEILALYKSFTYFLTYNSFGFQLLLCEQSWNLSNAPRKHKWYYFSMSISFRFRCSIIFCTSKFIRRFDI